MRKSELTREKQRLLWEEKQMRDEKIVELSEEELESLCACGCSCAKAFSAGMGAGEAESEE